MCIFIHLRRGLAGLHSGSVDRLGICDFHTAVVGLESSSSSDNISVMPRTRLARTWRLRLARHDEQHQHRWDAFDPGRASDDCRVASAGVASNSSSHHSGSSIRAILAWLADGPKIAEQPAPEVCDSELVTEAESSSVDRGESLPIIARMVIEIRSDGSRTIARGAVEDVVNGERVAIEASAASPIELSLSLARAISQTLSAAPSLAAKTLAANIRQRARRRVDRTWSRLRKRLRFGD